MKRIINGKDGGFELENSLLLVFGTRQTWQDEDREKDRSKQQAWFGHSWDFFFFFFLSLWLLNEW